MNSTTTQHPNMKYFDITCNGITKLLKQLNPYKAPGPDNISPRILKELWSSYGLNSGIPQWYRIFSQRRPI
jgi:hypothetical protein